MIKIITISLENEMDLVLAHKRTMKVAEKLGLTIATQTTFATAVSEIARGVIEHTHNGNLDIFISQAKLRFTLVCEISFDPEIHFTNGDAGFHYAQKLVPEFYLEEGDHRNLITMKLGLPKSLKLDNSKITILKKYFEVDEPLNAYEEIKQRNNTLHKIADEQEEKLRQTQLIDEKKTEFISIASHEIKTPITIIKAYSQLAKGMTNQSNERLYNMLGKIESQAIKLQSLVQQLLDVSKMENGSLQYDLEAVPCSLFIESMIEVQDHLYPDHTVIFDIPNDITFRIDRLRMEQVFSNLIGNAAKYSEKNTTIKISGVKESSEYLTVSVKDEGMGMSKSSIESIFEKFYRDKDVLKTHSGLGMGLYITSKIISDHGGRIWVESAENAGSTFHFTVPLE